MNPATTKALRTTTSRSKLSLAGLVNEGLHREAGPVLGFYLLLHEIHRVAPAEMDMQRYFGVTPPSVHQMVLILEANGLIERVPGRARSIRLLIAREELPELL